MADTFASPKQPSLFPISFPSISKEDYLLFYKNERSLFTLLLVILHRDVIQSIFVIGFLIWLEREGYTSKNVVEIMVNSLTPDVINQVVNQILTCLNFLHKKTNTLLCDSSSGQRYDISLLQSFLDLKRIHLKVLYNNGDSIFDEVSNIANDVLKKALDDILEQFINRRNVGGFGHVPLVINDSEEEIPPEDRTIFLTFSKGYPISESEVREYFTSMLGDFVESIHMQSVEPENQSLFARIVARHTSMVKAVVERDGPHGKSKYNINGKHVWARKYVKRKPSKDMGEGVSSPQR